jgi:hypothetical protein
MAPPNAAEPQVRYFSPMPRDYQFVPKGDVYVTSNVRKRTHAVGATLYVVVDKHKKPIGLRCPTSVYQEVTAAAQASAARRAAVVQLRDAAVEREFEAELLRLYPKVPRKDVANILKQALEKRSRRVGRTRTLNSESKVHLAVHAYIRHCHTPYDQLLKDGMEREKARQKVTNKLQEVARSWTGNTSRTVAGTEGGTMNRRKKTQDHRPGATKKARTTKPTGRARPRLVQLDSETPDNSGDFQDDSEAEESEGDILSILSEDAENNDTKAIFVASSTARGLNKSGLNVSRDSTHGPARGQSERKVLQRLGSSP